MEQVLMASTSVVGIRIMRKEVNTGLDNADHHGLPGEGYSHDL